MSLKWACIWGYERYKISMMKFWDFRRATESWDHASSCKFTNSSTMWEELERLTLPPFLQIGYASEIRYQPRRTEVQTQLIFRRRGDGTQLGEIDVSLLEYTPALSYSWNPERNSSDISESRSQLRLAPLAQSKSILLSAWRLMKEGCDVTWPAFQSCASHIGRELSPPSRGGYARKW